VRFNPFFLPPILSPQLTLHHCLIVQGLEAHPVISILRRVCDPETRRQLLPSATSQIPPPTDSTSGEVSSPNRTVHRVEDRGGTKLERIEACRGFRTDDLAWGIVAGSRTKLRLYVDDSTIRATAQEIGGQAQSWPLHPEFSSRCRLGSVHQVGGRGRMGIQTIPQS
jgi:hypothetical protein